MSATARHTQHPTLFATNASSLVTDGLSHLAEGHATTQQVPPALSDDDLAHGKYRPMLRVVDVASAQDALKHAAILDTPDFSTEASDAYLAEVFHACECADVLVCVVTPESYADALGLDLLRMFAASGMRMIVVANKVSQSDEAADDIVSLLHKEVGIGRHQCVTLPIVSGREAQSRVQTLLESGSCDPLVRSIETALSGSRDESIQRRQHIDWIRSHLPESIAPLRAQIESAARLRDSINTIPADSADHFAATYLARERYPAFDLAVVRVLRLLEIPMLGPALRLSNAAVRVPIRAVSRALGFSTQSKHTIADDERDAVIRCVLRSADRVKSELRSVDSTLAVSLPEMFLSIDETWIDQRIRALLEQHQAEVTARVEARAQAIFEALRAKPKVLAALRASNALAGLGSAAAVVISHGLNWHDAVLAPVAVGVQQELLRHGLGVFVDQQRTRLKEEHRALVATLVQQSIADALLGAVHEPADQRSVDAVFAFVEQLHADLHRKEGGAA